MELSSAIPENGVFDPQKIYPSIDLHRCNDLIPCHSQEDILYGCRKRLAHFGGPCVPVAFNKIDNFHSVGRRRIE